MNLHAQTTSHKQAEQLDPPHLCQINGGFCNFLQIVSTSSSYCGRNRPDRCTDGCTRKAASKHFTATGGANRAKRHHNSKSAASAKFVSRALPLSSHRSLRQNMPSWTRTRQTIPVAALRINSRAIPLPMIPVPNTCPCLLTVQTAPDIHRMPDIL